MEIPVLTDPEIEPSEKQIKKHLADSFKLYKKIITFTQKNLSDVEEVWSFYRDGRSWLCRFMKRSNTYFWIGIYEGFFKITFYLNTNSEKKIMASDLPQEMKDEYLATKERKVRWISLQAKSDEDFDIFRTLLSIKTKYKIT
ncbi:MAG: hypothetical protein A2X64_05600 [Ignavibacteria bacterium GWF2_33_9]|nr:MAG: hypothetical protein A2X64_05600 [Ignavibacteria bacterium GWF2_33_9]